MSTTKHRVIGARCIPGKLGVNWPNLWRVSADLDHFLPAGETIESMVQHAANHGCTSITIWLRAGDHPSQAPHFEPRPGEFNWAGEAITRNGNGDITSTLYTSAQSCPSSSNIKKLLDECYRQRVFVYAQLGASEDLTVADDWDYYAYKQNRLNALDNVEALGDAGWMTTPSQMWDNASSIAAYKVRVDALVNSFGDHIALKWIGLGKEFVDKGKTDQSDFFDWCDEMETYVYDAFPAGNKPIVFIDSEDTPWASETVNNCWEEFDRGGRGICWHNYGRGLPTYQPIKLNNLKAEIDAILNEHDTYSYSPGYAGELRKWYFRIGENWGFGAAPSPVEDTVEDINIQGDPVLHTYAYENPPDDTVSPYPHERMWAFLAMVLDPTMSYSRWPALIDGSSSMVNTYKRIAEILEVAKDMYDTLPACPSYPQDMERWETNISSDGVLDFKAALYLPVVCLPFVFVGSGNQEIDFGVTGAWTIVTYDWQGGVGGISERVLNEVAVADASAYTIAFGDYTDGFCPGYLIKSTGYRNPVRTTITTEVVVQVN